MTLAIKALASFGQRHVSTVRDSLIPSALRLCVVVGVMFGVMFLALPGWGDILVRQQARGNNFIPVPKAQIPTTTGILYLRNDSATSTALFRLSTTRTPDLSTFDAILAEARRTATDRTTPSLARAAYNIISQYRLYNWTSARADAEVYDPVKLLNVYGYGLCDASARALATVLHGLGIRTAVWDLWVHVVTEFYDGKTSQTLDPDLRVHAYVGGTTRTIPAIQMRSKRNLLQPAEVDDPQQAVELRNRLVHALDTTTRTPILAWWKPIFGHDARIRLRPGESMTRYSSSRLGYYATLDSTPPPTYANTIFRWERELPPAVRTEDDVDNVRIRTKLPFVIVGGYIKLVSHEPGIPPPTPLVSPDGVTYTACEQVETESDSLESSATYLLPDAVIGNYTMIVWLNCEDSLPQADLPRMRFEQVIITQSSPTTFPQIEGGEGEDFLEIRTSDEVPYEVQISYQVPDYLKDDIDLVSTPDDN